MYIKYKEKVTVKLIGIAKEKEGIYVAYLRMKIGDQVREGVCFKVLKVVVNTQMCQIIPMIRITPPKI